MNDLALIDEPAKPVGSMAVREMKMIPDQVGMVSLAFFSLCVGIEVCNNIGVKFQHRNIILFHGTVCDLLVFYLLILSTSLNGLYHFKGKLYTDLESLVELIMLERCCKSIFVN